MNTNKHYFKTKENLSNILHSIMLEYTIASMVIAIEACRPIAIYTDRFYLML